MLIFLSGLAAAALAAWLACRLPLKRQNLLLNLLAALFPLSEIWKQLLYHRDKWVTPQLDCVLSYLGRREFR